MSPTKRSSEELWMAGVDDNNNDDQNDNTTTSHQIYANTPMNGIPSMPSPKRIRGGGRGDDDNNNEEELFDEEFVEMAEEEEIAEYMADEVVSDDTAARLLQQDNVIAASKAKWVRPPLASAWDTTSQDLNVQWLDIDVVGGPPLQENPNPSRTSIAGNTCNSQVPIIRVYGVNDQGHSVTIFIHGFTPYAYFSLPQTMDESLFTDSTRSEIRKAINDRLKSSAKGETHTNHCLAVEYTNEHKSIMGYETQHTQFLKVHLAMPTLVPKLRRIMNEGIDLNIPGHAGEQMFEPFECNVPFVLRYMIDQDITGAGWLTLPQNTYQVRPENKRQTHCQVCIIYCL